ncbi:MAG: phosphoesterase [Caulobacteraceae bacterium]|jgi:undecaprenyl-diphosphatase|nr:phosphoesterase [Caulobacteraceae bacterium]
MQSLDFIKHRTPGVLALARREIGPILAVLALGALLLSFRAIADEVGEGGTHAFDTAILYALRVPGHPQTPIGPWWLTTAATDVTSLGSITVLSIIVLLVFGLIASLRRVREASVLLVASVGGMLLTALLKDVFQRDRPPLVLHLAPAVNASFPSGHATLSATVYLTLGALIAHFAGRRRVRIYALSAAVILALIVGFSRVYLGVHWPTDVLAGWCVGSAWALVCWSGALLWERIAHSKLTTAPKAEHALPATAHGADAGVLSEGA